MATETKLATGVYLELSRQEASNIVGLLVAQLADQSGSCPEVKVTEGGGIKHLRLFILDDKLEEDGVSREIIQDHMRIITLSRQEAANIIVLLSTQLADVPLLGKYQPQPLAVCVFKDGKLDFRLVLGLSGTQDRIQEKGQLPKKPGKTAKAR